MRREVAFDAAGRPTALRALRDGALEGELAVAWADGRPTSADDSVVGGAEHYEWDAAGELAAIAFPEGDRLEIERDLRGRAVRERYRLADGSLLREIGLGWDGAGRPTRLEEDGALLVAVAWSAGRLSSTSFGNGLVRSYAYDAETGLLAAATSVGPGGAVVEASQLAIEPDPAAGALRLVAETASAGPAAAVTREEFALGPLGGAGKRLVGWGDGASERVHAADLLANTTLRGEDAFVYDDEAGRLIARIDASSGALRTHYAWDAAGFCVVRGGVALAWTALGRIAAIGGAASFAWDLQGRPLRRRVAGDEVRYRFGGRVETDAAGAPRRLDLGLVALRLDTGERRYRHLDFRGNVKLESDDAGGIALHRRYGPTGSEAGFGSDDGAASFAGGRDVAGLLLVGARVLDPQAGRFLSPDPVLQLVNQYGYALANPVSFWDPDGREIQPVGFLYGAGVTLGGAIGARAVGGLLGSFIGGPLGALIGLAVAEAIYQQLNPGEHLFTLRDALEAVTPMHVDPPDGSDRGTRPSVPPRGRRGGGDGGDGPDVTPQPRNCDCAATSFGGLRFSAFGAYGVSGAVGGGWSGF
jgi:RHS repeat-associated protein